MPADHPGVLATTVEALWRVEHTEWWRRHRHERTEIQVWRHRELGERQIERITDFALKHVNDRYGWWKLGAHLADRVLFSGDKRISRLLHVDSRPICSYLVARAFDAVGVNFGMRAVSADPDEMLDWVQRPDQAGRWGCVGHEVIHG